MQWSHTHHYYRHVSTTQGRLMGSCPPQIVLCSHQNLTPLLPSFHDMHNIKVSSCPPKFVHSPLLKILLILLTSSKILRMATYLHHYHISALEVFYDNALYKFTFHISHFTFHILGHMLDWLKWQITVKSTSYKKVRIKTAKLQISWNAVRRPIATMQNVMWNGSSLNMSAPYIEHEGVLRALSPAACIVRTSEHNFKSEAVKCWLYIRSISLLYSNDPDNTSDMGIK